MRSINEFSNDVIEQLGCYVYRLIDPRSGQTFYVGRGQGNRVFQHALAVDDFYSRNDLNEQDNINEYDDDPAKIKMIKQIKSEGLEVIHVIQRWGMTLKESKEVESSFIDFFSLSTLSNIIGGYQRERGMRYTHSLQKELSAEVFVENEETPKFMIIKISDWSIMEYGGGDTYEAVRKYWVVDTARANKYPYVLAVIGGLVKEVYEVDKDGWQRNIGEKRSYFTGKVANESIRLKFIDKRIPTRFVKKGSSNPIQYSK